MASINHQKTFGGFIFFIVALSHISSNGFVEGRKVSIKENMELVKHTENKTIVTEDGDIIDCVDIYKQPAFSHPLLKNHIVQMKPSSIASGLEARNGDAELFQGWFKNGGGCPEGTIPIVRSRLSNRPRPATPFIPHNTHPDQSLSDLPDLQHPNDHEFGLVSLAGEDYFGAQARINLWNPVANSGEFSSAKISVTSRQGDVNTINAVEAGWQIKGEEKEPRLFIYWTKDNYKSTGCYNLDCPGFVQTNKNIPLGIIFKPISIFGGKQYDITISIQKDAQSGNWWLKLQNQDVGYWPSSIFTTLAKSGTMIYWGGEILNTKPNGQHTSTQMGSGHFPSEGLFGISSFFANLGYFDTTGALKEPQGLSPHVTHPGCYDVLIDINAWKTNNKVHFYYGGSGLLSEKCRF